MKLVNISLYTVIDIHEYREILETAARLVMFLSSPRRLAVYSFSFHSGADWPLLRFPSLCGTTDNTVIRTVDGRCQIIVNVIQLRV